MGSPGHSNAVTARARSPFTLLHQGVYVVLLIRGALSVFLAFIISRFFFQGGGWLKIIGLAAIMFILAYLFEYTRKRDKGGGHGN